MRARLILLAVAALAITVAHAMSATAAETMIRAGLVDALLTSPDGYERPPVALLIAGSGPTDRDGNSRTIKPATLKKLSEQLVARGIATLRYNKRGAVWKPEFGRPEDFRFPQFVDDAVALIDYLRDSGRFSRVAVIGHSEGALIATLAAERTAFERLVMLTGTAQRQGDLVKQQLSRSTPPDQLKPIAAAIDAIMAGQIVDPPPPGFSIPPAAQPGIASAFIVDPIPSLRQATQPVLIVGGGQDVQVGRPDFDALAAASPHAKTLWLERMNHVLVDVTDEADNRRAYTETDRPLNPELIETLAAFL